MNRQCTYRASQFRGDQFLRFTAEEARLIAHAEALHGYDPQHAGRMPVSAPPPPPLPPSTGDAGVRTITRRRRLFYLGNTLLLEREYDEDDPSFYSEEGELTFVLDALLGADEVHEDDYDEELDEEEDEEEEGEDW